MQVLITRPVDQARSTVASLKDIGYQALVDPLLMIEPVAVDWSGLDPAALIVTSANAVHAIPDKFTSRPVFAVGRATARTLDQHGCEEIIEGPGSAEYLMPIIKEHKDLLTGPVVYLSGDHVKADLDGELREAGYEAHRRVAYRSVASEKLSEETLDAIENETLDAVTFFSPRSGQIFVELIQEEGLEDMFEHVGAVCLSPTIARSVSSLRWRRLLIASGRTQSALLACLERLE